VRLGTALALRGVGSFAVVPIHMFLIVLVSHAASLPMSGRVYVIAILPFVVLNYWLAARADREARRVGVRTPVGSPAWNATAATLAAAAFVVTILPLGFVRIAGATIAQLLVAVLLTVRPQRTAVV